MTVEFGQPVWTTGVLGRPSALDDLGIEEVGGGLLRRLLPGIIQNTPNAGYYSFYPYLLWKWEQLGGDLSRKEFQRFYRRQECAFAVSCALHSHRDGVGLSGLNGGDSGGRAAQEIDAGLSVLDLDAMAEGYMDTPLGGYGLFYAATLQDARLVRAGAAGLVDKTTEHGAAVAEAFAESFEDTRYYRDHFSEGPVPSDVLRELGDAVCLCTVPGRPDHPWLLDTFFGDPLADPSWEERRRSRVESLCLFLEFHGQRPPGAQSHVGGWRRALVDPRFSDGTPWITAHEERRNSWRAYQCREVAVLALTTLWCLYLLELQVRARATHAELRNELTSWLNEDDLGFPPLTPLSRASELASDALMPRDQLVAEVEPLHRGWQENPRRSVCRALRALLALRHDLNSDAPGFSELLDEGGRHRWSLAYLDRWFEIRETRPTAEVFAELVDELHHQHVRVALSKVRVPSARNLRANKGRWRDPFCFAEDDEVLRPLRSDVPFWTGARYQVVNQLLWTLGLIDVPRGESSLTDLGREYLRRHASA